MWTSCNADPFWYCNIALVFKKRRYGEFVTWNDSEYQRIIDCVRTHRLLPGGYFVWRTAFHPLFKRFWPPGVDLPDINVKTTSTTIRITPYTSGEWNKERKWFRLIFSSKGFIVATVGYSKKEQTQTQAGTILGITYAMLDLFCQEEILSYYKMNFLLEKANLFFCVSNSPSSFILTSKPFGEFYNYQEHEYRGEAIIINKSKCITLVDLTPETLSKELTKELVKEAGFRGLEDKIDKFNINDVIYHI
ncbi:hypothetical protein MGLY_31960 [Neomoorella glycerini]|uniref:Uncharacterized protein n=2 Tax=Neomoorella glycerini TaxID=55779 RepID=A0A6I5ZV77_9FIRM|nr:hypothetical protein MGLY_31960 [Moorella glycerini]